jgi:hypothetical protein
MHFAWVASMFEPNFKLRKQLQLNLSFMIEVHDVPRLRKTSRGTPARRFVSTKR